MKILAFVDMHGHLPALKTLLRKAKEENVDVVVCAGDFTIFSNHLYYILHELNTLGKPILVIPGNHENGIEIRKCCILLENCIALHNNKFRLGEYLFIGYGGGGFDAIDKGFEKSSKQFLKLLKKEDKPILVTHAPPYNTRVDNLNGIHCGNRSIRNFIKKAKPVLAVCGHLHETMGKEDRIGKTRVINPGYVGKIIEI